MQIPLKSLDLPPLVDCLGGGRKKFFLIGDVLDRALLHFKAPASNPTPPSLSREPTQVDESPDGSGLGFDESDAPGANGAGPSGVNGAGSGAGPSVVGRTTYTEADQAADALQQVIQSNHAENVAQYARNRDA